MESARLARRDDLVRVAELWGLAARELGAQRGGRLLVQSVTPPPPWRHTLADAMDKPDRVLAVGSIDHVIVGFGYGKVEILTSTADSERPTTGSDAPVGVIEILYVEPEGRGIGVGEAMVDVLMDHFRAAGCQGVDAYALPGNRAAKSFFETHGFVTRMLVMHRPTGSEL